MPDKRHEALRLKDAEIHSTVPGNSAVAERQHHLTPELLAAPRDESHICNNKGEAPHTDPPLCLARRENRVSLKAFYRSRNSTFDGIAARPAWHHPHQSTARQAPATSALASSSTSSLGSVAS